MEWINGHYGFEGKGTKNFAMTKYISFQMCEKKNVYRQIENFQKISFQIRQRGWCFTQKGLWPISLSISCKVLERVYVAV